MRGERGGIGGDLRLGLYSLPRLETDRNGRNDIVKQELGSFLLLVLWILSPPCGRFEVLQSDRSKQPQLRASPGSGPLYVVKTVEGGSVCECECVCGEDRNDWEMNPPLLYSYRGSEEGAVLKALL